MRKLRLGKNESKHHIPAPPVAILTQVHVGELLKFHFRDSLIHVSDSCKVCVNTVLRRLRCSNMIGKMLEWCMEVSVVEVLVPETGFWEDLLRVVFIPEARR